MKKYCSLLPLCLLAGLYSTLDYAAMSKYIDNVDCRVYGDYAFCSFNHSEKLYRTVWSLKDASLLFSTAISGPDDVLGPQVEINGEQVCVAGWW